uniref:T9SS type A sorting domain-containing protein n=2 Tax=uncultured Psychroserpens sp. TaxID=255436 RepID=UPI0026129C29
SFEPGSLGYTNGGTGACEISGSVQGELSGSYDECGGTLYVDWTYTDDCDRTITAKKTITVLPAPMAEFDEVEDMEISCEEANSYEAGSLGYTNGGTGACEISGEVQGELSGSYDECGGTLTVNWTYTDDCQRTIEASKTITVLPAPMAEFDEVEDMEISCEEANSFEAGSLGYTNGGTGACEISGSVQGELSGSYDECGGTLYIDWTYTDDCDRTITAKKTITVLPAPMAEFDEVEDMEISCEEANSYEAGSLGYTNGGTGACEISGEVQGELSGSYDECGGTLTVNWTYTDDCQRTIEASKTITVLPAPMAEFDEVEDMEISCEEANSFEPGSLGYTNGGTGACEISGEVQGELSGSYDECGGTLYIDWTYTDDCDRTITAKKTITVLPAPMAEFNDVQDISIACELASQYEVNPLGYTNGGTGACEISGEVDGELSGTYDECGGTLYVDWTYTDDCNRTITARKTITVEPAPMAEFDEVEDMEISCEEANSFEAGSLGYTNGGTGACEISGEVQGELSGSYDECGGELYVDWTYTDDCDRTITAKKMITVLPAPMAEFDEVEDMEVTCEEAASVQAGSLGYTNGGTGACEISGSVEGELSGSYDECGGTLTVNWTYTDDCQRTIEASKTITVLPAPMAEFDEVEDMEVSCEEANSYEAGSLGYTNGGTGACEISGEVQGELSGSYDECGGTLTVNWTYIDDCQRTIHASKTITVLPAPMAEFDEVEDMEISCEEANSFEPGSLGYTNGGTGACEISGEVQGELSGSYDECGGQLEVDWTYTDDCDRTITAKKTITVLPAPMAEFDEVEDMEVTCEEAASVQAGSLGYTNGGTGACEISGSVEGELSGSYDECGGTLTVNWTYTDDCNRTITASKTITVLPAPAAEFNDPGEMEISCTEALDFESTPLGYTNGETGACEISGEVDGTVIGDYTTCGGFIYVDYTFTDDCGRKITAKKVITVLPAEEAEFDEVEDMEISCEEAETFEAGSLGYTNGGRSTCRIEGSVEGELSGSYDECGGTLTANWTYTDECDRTITASKTITVLPAPIAEFDEVEDMEISCEDVDSFEGGSLSYNNGATGACEISGSVQGVPQPFEGSCGSFEVDYTFTDECGRTITAKKTVTVIDNEAPAPTGVCDNETMTIEGCPATAEISLQIGDEISIADRDWTVGGISIEELNGTLAPCFTDNCAATSDLTFRVIGKDAERKDCYATLTVTFEVEDTCENVSEPFTCTFIVEDTTAPTFNEELPGDIAIECGEEIPAAPVLTASDDCSDATVDYDPGNFRRECKADDASNHTLWIANNGGLDASNRNWTSTSTSSFVQYSNGTAKLTGTVANVNNANQIFEFVAWFKDASTYEEWTSIPNAASPTGFRQAKLDAGTSNGATLADAQTWTYYLMDESKDNKLVGQGDYAGVELSLSHNPTNLRYGLQYGEKASLQSNGLGVSTWIKIQGDYNGNSFNSNGDFNIALSDCVEDPNFDLEGQCDATIVRTWTATDACGNETVHTQTITISDNTPPVVECPEDVDFGYVTETPSGFADKAPYTDNCGTSGQTQVFTDSETTVTPGDVTQVSTEFRFIFQAGYILTFGDAPIGNVNDAPYYQGYVTDLNGVLLPQYGNFELIFFFNGLFQDYSIVQNGEEVGYGPMIDGLPSCNSADWYVESVNGHNKALTVECGQYESTTEYSFTRTFYAVDECGNEGECSVEYTWTSASNVSRNGEAEEGFEFYPTNRDPEARVAHDVTVDFKAYPVPFDKEVNISYSFEFDTNVTIELFDTKGLLILSETNDRYVTGSKDKTTFDLSRISNQMFYVKLTTSQGSVTKKIVSSGKK